MSNETQETVDALANDVRSIAPSGKLADVEQAIKAKAHHSLELQAGFLRRLISTFQDADPDLAQFRSAPVRSGTDDTRKRPAKTNPFGKEGWNVSAQGKMFQALGEAKTREIAASAGVSIGDTRWNEDYNR